MSVQMAAKNSVPQQWGPEERKKYVAETATKAGLSAFAKAAVFSVPTVLLLNQYYKPFRMKMTASAKTAMAISPPVLAYAFVSDHMTARMANPDGFASYVEQHDIHEYVSLPIHKQIANYYLYNPFKALIFTSIPVVAGIFLTRDAQNLKLSQRIMHTRVMGQASVLAILTGTMLFNGYMSKRGPFTE